MLGFVQAHNWRKPPSPGDILKDRLLISALLFGSAGYIVEGSFVGVAMLIAAFILAVVWCWRLVGTHPRRGIRLMGTLLLVILGTFMTVYVAYHQGVIR
ncbi:MAG TPA: hypothetical protein VI322_04005 [Candidatus Saccharimonadia bacterium]